MLYDANAEGLLQQGDRKGAFALYRVLSRPDLPKAVRVAAMHSTIAALGLHIHTAGARHSRSTRRKIDRGSLTAGSGPWRR